MVPPCVEPGGAGRMETNNLAASGCSRQSRQRLRLFTLRSESQERQLGQRQCQVTLATPHCSQREACVDRGRLRLGRFIGAQPRVQFRGGRFERVTRFLPECLAKGARIEQGLAV